MKVAIFSDLHLGIRQDSPEWHATAFAFADFLAAECKRRGITEAVFLGDFFHSRHAVSVATLDAADSFLKRLYPLHLHMVLGNHDLHLSNDFGVSGVNLFGNFPNITVYREAAEVDIGGKRFVMCGWGRNPLEHRGDVLCTHLEIAMFRFNPKSHENTEGVKCSALLERYGRIFSGHFHMRQEKSYSNGTIRYTGNPFPMDHSDGDGDKGFDVYDTDTGEVEFVANPTGYPFKHLKLSELKAAIDGGADLASLVGRSHFKLLVDTQPTVDELNLIDTAIAAATPASYIRELEAGAGGLTAVDSFGYDASEFNMRSIIREFCGKMDLAEEMRAEVLAEMLRILARVEEAAA